MYEAGEWVTPISILGTTKINETDNALEAIMNTDANSIRNFINAEFVDIETFLSTLASVDITYDNGISGLTATNVQSAIDEVEARVDINDGKVTNYNQTGAEIKTAYEAEANAYTDTKNTKLAGIAENANDYDHPTGDGNKHVPANSTTNEGKVLTAGAVAGTYTWEDSVGGITEEAEAQTKIGDLTIGETISVASWSYSGTTITVNTSTIHNVIVGQYFSVSGLIADTNAPNGRWAVATVIDTDSITFTAVDTPTGTPTVSSAELSHGDITLKGAFKEFDLGQTWQDVTASRVSGTIYTNNTGKPIYILVFLQDAANIDIDINGELLPYCSTSLNTRFALPLIIPNGNTYKLTNVTKTWLNWFELR